MDIKGWGFGATFGLMVKPADWISFGATYRTQSNISLSGDMEIENLNMLGLETTSGAKMSVPSPMWLAGGVALKPLPKLTLTLDAQYTNWGKLDELGIEFDDPEWQVALADEDSLLLNWKDQTQLRAGIEYDLGTLAIRGGYYYDPAPAPDETLNILTPSFTFHSVALGLGYEKGGFKLDLALEYLMGDDRAVAPSGDNLPGLYEMKIIVPIIAFSYAW
jgi:long-chain fatty acid transport protein